MTKLLALFGGLMAGMTWMAPGADPVPPPVAPPVLVSKIAAEEAAPKIQFATPIYDFGRVKSGEHVKFDFIFTNVGNALLELTAVQPGCGCTTAGEWTRQVEPGHTGHIPIQFNAGGISGPVAKGITVTCNDKSQPTVSLQIKGTIWKPVDVIPQYAILNGTAEVLSNATSVVRIVNNEEPPLALLSMEISNPAFVAELKTNQPGKEYEVAIRLAKPLETGNANGVITFKSSSTNSPTVVINTVAYLQPTIVATPPAISLPMAPITNDINVTVSVRIEGGRLTKLFPPSVSGKNVEVLMKEVEPGRLFSFTLAFPAGFEIAPGESVELSARTDNPQFPTFVRVPISQLHRPSP